MRILSFALIIVGLVAAGCRGPQRQDLPDAGYAHALECLRSQGSQIGAAIDSCSERSFHPGSVQYSSGWKAALDCASSREGSADEVADACSRG